MKASVRLTDSSSHKITVPATVNSVMLTNHLSFVEEDEDETILDIQLSTPEWQMYIKFVTEIAKIEKETGKRFVPNQAFSKEFFGSLEQTDLESYSKIADYMICQVLHDSLDFFIGSLFDLDRDTILKAYNITETPELKKRACHQTREAFNDLLVAKALEIVPELAGLNITFRD